MSSTDYYNILNLDKNCTPEEIKKSFRSLSFKHHPDKNNGEDKLYKKITEAYNVLSDPVKKREYDIEQNAPNPEDIINMFFGGLGNPMQQGMHMGGGRGGIPGLNNMFHSFPVNAFFDQSQVFKKFVPIKPIKHKVFVSLSDIFNKRSVTTIITRSINNNNVITQEQEELTIPVPYDIYDSNTVILEEKGNIYNGKHGDVKIQFNIIKDETFEINKNDIYYYHKISLKEALCGFSITINYLDNKVYKINNTNTVIYPNYKKKVNNLGLYSRDGQGSLYIMFHIEFPMSLDDEQRKQLEDIL